MSFTKQSGASFAESAKAEREEGFKEGAREKECTVHLKQRNNGNRRTTRHRARQTVQQRQAFQQVRREWLDAESAEEREIRLQQLRDPRAAESAEKPKNNR